MSDSQESDSLFAEISHPKKRAFLAAMVETGGNVTRATQLAEISHGTPYTRQWLDDEEFQAALERARVLGADNLEAEAIRRAHDGVEEPVGFYKGAPSAYVRRYSDTLLIFLLKGAKPERYADRQKVEHSGNIEVTADELRDRLHGRIAGVASRIGANGDSGGTEPG